MTHWVEMARAATVAGVLLAASSSLALAEGAVEFKDIEGKWCGDLTNYHFSRSRLRVTFHSGRDDRVLAIEKINTGVDKTNNGWIEFIWEGKGNTVFADFSPNKREMVQQANVGGDNGPRRVFKRC